MKKILLTASVCLALAFNSNAQGGVGWAGNQSPNGGSYTTTSGSPSVSFSVQVYKDAVTPGAGQGSGITCEFAFSSVSSFGGSWGTVQNVSLTYSSEVGNNDVFSGSFTPSAIGLYEGKCRCRHTSGTAGEYYWTSAPNVQITASSVLSAELSAFTATKNSNRINIDWSVNSNDNRVTYEIERSNNANTFNKLGEVAAKAGAAEAVRNYTFVDESPLAGINYYRLKMVDNYEKITYSKVVSVNNSGKGGRLALTPNPARDVMTVALSADRDGDALVQVIDIVGRTVVSEKRNLTKGDNQVAVNVAHLPYGSYFINVNGQVAKFQKN